MWKKITKRQKLNYNVYHRASIFKENDKMFLQNITIRILRFKKKIDHRQQKLFIIIERIRSQTYCLILFVKYNVIHNVFYMSLLKL